MSRGAAIALVVIVALAGFIFLPGMISETTGGYSLHVSVQFTAIDSLAGGTDATTTQVKIYDTNFEVLETVTISTAAGTDSAIKYTSGTYLYLWIDDLTDTSLCHIYKKIMVPFHSSDADTKHYIDLKTVDTDASWDVVCDYSNGTNLANSGTHDYTLDGAAPTFVWQVLTPTADKGYKSSWNFVEGIDNAAYYFWQLSGTGATRVSFDSNKVVHYFDGSYHWYAVKLQDADLTRDLKSDGTYDPIGYYTLPVKFDLTLESGDSVTCAHGLKYNADFEYLKSHGNWGPDVATVSESITIQY